MGYFLKYGLPLMIVFLFSTAFKKQDSDQKLWDKNSPLSWEDFKKVDRPDYYGEGQGANTFVGELYRYRRLGKDSSSNVFEFQVQSVMVRSMSHVEPGYKTASLLEHEQLHFDLSEYFARQLLIAFKRGTYTKNFRSEIKDIRHTFSVQRDAMEKLYDKQTDHSRNNRMQLKWNSYVQLLLKDNVSIETALKNLP